jgi:transcriptional regulator with AAA-type ATPase domain
MIRGESGTGKELVARAIVANSAYAKGPFISVNCAALPDALIESELFGHEKGAFTGAHQARPGQIELADKGTLFLDEIGTMGLGPQSKLLRVLEQHAVQRIAGKAPRKIDFRRKPFASGVSAKTSITGSTSSPSTCRRCVNARATSLCWFITSSVSTVPPTRFR